jgi:hypothetical protein
MKTLKITFFCFITFLSIESQAQLWNIPANGSAVGTDFVGTTAGTGNGDLSIRTLGVEKMKVWGTGTVSIGGVTTPNGQLHFSNSAVNRKIVLWDNQNDQHRFYGFGISSFTLRYHVDGTSSNHVFFAGTSSTTSNELMRIQGDGRVGIGTSCLPTDAKLAVNGKIYATAVQVKLTNGSGCFPDYVRALGEVEAYINQNQHLPNVPSAAEVEKNGLDMAEMDIMLLEKVEELTLYMIQMKKENESLKKDIEELKKK